MADSHWQRVKAVFQAALDRAPEQRAAYVREACGDDTALAAEVESLLAAHERAGSFAEHPAMEALGEAGIARAGGVLRQGETFGPYEIAECLGVGGMGEVYRARDTKLGRDVAIKILPREFTDDRDRLARFEREARVLASLNHPGIGAIYGLEDAGGKRALVLELVEGVTLADRLSSGPVPVNEALSMARQIAEALEAAHERGIIHRDLKPANIKITPDGRVKVLDFGLAKWSAGQGTELELSQAPAAASHGTRGGEMLGTAAYMSPEQARGLVVDKRTDIWAFGCVFYEMLSGRQAFGGPTLSDTIVAILEREPDWTRLPSDVPASVWTVLRLCMEKDLKKRRRDAGDVGIDLGSVLAEPIATMPAATPARGASRILMAALAVVAALIVGLVSIPALRDRLEAPSLDVSEMRTEIVTPTSASPFFFALSPDGRQLVFVAFGEDGVPRLWLRPLASTSAQPLAGTEHASNPFWSPDSRSVGFFADDKLKRLDIGGGPPQVLTNEPGRGGTWNADGVILFGRTAGPLYRVPASGGEAVAVTTLDRQTSHRLPSFLPGGRQFLFYALGTPDTGGIYLGSLGSTETKRLAATETAGVYTPAGWLLWVRAGTLVAQRLDLQRGELVGDPVTVADSVALDGRGAGAVSASPAGLVAYRSSLGSRRQLVWFNRSGETLGTINAPEGQFQGPSLSPDGRRVAVWRTVEGNADIWLLEGARTSRFTFDPALDRWPVWSPDGSRVVFNSTRNGLANLYLGFSDRAGSEQLLVDSPQDKMAHHWSADGRFLIYYSQDPQTDRDLWVLPMDGDRKPWVFLKTIFDEGAAQFSPDGRWVAYASNESGRSEIYVRPFVTPAAGQPDSRATGQRQVSTEGGVRPHWSSDGREMYYFSPGDQLMAASIGVTDTTLEPGPPVALFRALGGSGSQMNVSPDGRFLINTLVDDGAAPITLVLNWKPRP